MIDDEEIEDTSEEDGEGKSSGKASGGGGGGGGGMRVKTPPPMGAGFFDQMKNFGVSGDQLAKIINDWSHHKGGQVEERLEQFVEGLARVTDPISRASSQLVVDFGKQSYDMVIQFLVGLKQTHVREFSKERNRGRNRGQQRGSKNPRPKTKNAPAQNLNNNPGGGV